ncbi:MAG: family 4 glycosyl hydrolase, alpha-galactosidase/6-phospho-beta-glucosidase [Bacillota bacterium]|jgi:6-phospho-beta-glucosidase|nr:family 4 glycosyl hydrolase, alpha-galactosidase/6-phospho-beta-glucosidase [Bacillota bacterium]
MEGKLKIAVIGGGSSYTPELIEGILNRKDELPVSELWLVDVEEGKEKLRIITALAQRMAARSGAEIKIAATLDRREAILDADYVITQFRVGFLKAREKDELIPLKYNVIGQETTGPGGFAKAMRTIPVMLEICREMEELAPDAWLINFTNPSGIITEAVKKHSKVRVLGLCNIPVGMLKDIAKLLSVEAGRVTAEFVGLNHMNFVRDVFLDGISIMDALLKQYGEESLREKIEAISDTVWDLDFMKSLRMIPSPYHRYFYRTKTMLEEEQESLKSGGSRAMRVQEIERELFRLYADENLAEKPKLLEERGGAYYSEAAISLISAVYNNKNENHIVNVTNEGTISNLPYDAVIEANCIVGRSGAKPLILGKADVRIAGLLNAVKAYEQLTIEAAVSGDYHTALMALCANPLVNEFSDTKAILNEFLAAHRPYLDYVRKRE